jgi:DHA2 family multidrug resistance protein-like MFS transporter
VGGTIGGAVLGTVIDSVYRSGLTVSGLPAAAANAARGSVASGVATARAAGSAPLLHAVRVSYVHGMDVMLWVCGAIALASALLGLAFLPRWARPPAPVTAPGAMPDAPPSDRTPSDRTQPDGAPAATRDVATAE